MTLPYSGEGFQVGLARTTFTQDPAWCASAHKVHRVGGITIDADSVTAVSGVKRLKGGTFVGKNDATGLWEPYTAGVAPFRVIGTVGANNAVRLTSKRLGDAVTTSFVIAGASTPLSVVADEEAGTIVVNVATNGGSAAISTATQVINAINNHRGASDMITATNEGASTGAGVVVAGAAAALAGAVNANVTPTDILFEDVDVTAGDAAAGTMIHGVVLENRLPSMPDAVVRASMPGIHFVRQ